MAETQIEWTDATWNPVAGCSIVTEGCTHCYAMEMAKRLKAMGVEKYAGLTRKTGKRTVWNGVVREHREALSIPYRWRKPRKNFVNSMSDLFHERVSDEFTVLALPPRSPELNPVENVWQFMRDNWLSNRIFKSYEDIVALCCQAWNNLIDQPWKIMSLGMRKWAHGF